jgi:hypothetical protein
MHEWAHARAHARTHAHMHTHTHTHTHTCFIHLAIVGSTGSKFLLESSGVRPPHSIWCPPLLQNVSHWGPLSEEGTAKSNSGWDPESMEVRWRQECFSQRGIAAQQALCGLVHYVIQKPLSLPLVTQLPLNCIMHPLQNLYMEMWKWSVTLCPGDTNSWCAKPLMSKNSRNLLTAPCMLENDYACEMKRMGRKWLWPISKHHHVKT